MTMKLYIGNLSFSTNQDDLRDIFGNYGEVLSASVITDRETGRSRGFGFVEMDDAGGRKAIAEADGTEHGGRKLRVNEAQKRERERR
ncbi:MAG: RNA-binding protein [Candidatus Adiutrix sp.]|jgi:RNA recognition motif-containing protein|nr:RNA-binding protein [Candidatus Adiutrix sp.]